MDLNNSLYQQIFNNSDNPTLLLQGETIVAVSQSVTHLLGYSAEDLKGKSIADVADIQPLPQSTLKIMWQTQISHAQVDDPLYFYCVWHLIDQSLYPTKVNLKLLQAGPPPFLQVTLFETEDRKSDFTETDNQVRLVNTVSQVASLLTEQGLDVLDIGLELLGNATQVSAIVYFEVVNKKGRFYWQRHTMWHKPAFNYDVLPDQIPIEQSSFIATELRQQHKVTRLIEEIPPADQAFWQVGNTLSVALLAISGEYNTPGLIAFYETQYKKLWSENELAILQTVAAVLTNTLAREKLLTLMQNNLAETEKLYKTSQAISTAKTWREVMAAVAEGLPISGVNHLHLFIFTYNQSDELQKMTLVATWSGSEEDGPVAVGSEYNATKAAELKGFLSKEAIFWQNIEIDLTEVERNQLFHTENTKAMAILPLWSGDQQLGCVVLEGDYPHVFSQAEKRAYLSTLGQITAFVQNQQLLAETRTALAEVEATQKRYIIQAWDDYRKRQKFSFYEHGQSTGTELTRANLVAGASRKKQPVLADNKTDLAMPILLRGEVIGVVGLQRQDDKYIWLPQEIELVREIVTQFAQVADGFRLLDETQQRAARESRVNEIGEKIQVAQSLDEALQIAIKEIGISLESSQTIINMEVE